MSSLARAVVGAAVCLMMAPAIATAAQAAGGRRPHAKKVDYGYNVKAGPDTRIAMTIGKRTILLDSIAVSVPKKSPYAQATTVTIARRAGGRLAALLGSAGQIRTVLIAAQKRRPGGSWDSATGWDYQFDRVKVARRGPVSVLLPTQMKIAPAAADHSKMPKAVWERIMASPPQRTPPGLGRKDSPRQGPN